MCTGTAGWLVSDMGVRYDCPPHDADITRDTCMTNLLLSFLFQVTLHMHLDLI